MSQGPPRPLTDNEASDVVVRAGSVFLPNSPVSTRSLFAGRWEQIEYTMDSVQQTGLHAIIYGERGVGKTSLANIIQPLLEYVDEQAGREEKRIVVKINTSSKDTFGLIWCRALDEVGVPTDRIGIGENKKDMQPFREVYGINENSSVDEIRRVLAYLVRSVFIFDEFDRLAANEKQPFTDLIKGLSDFTVQSTVILVGVSDAVDQLVEDHSSIVRAITQIKMPRMGPSELRDILSKGEEALQMRFTQTAADRIINMSQGLPHYTHLIGLHAVRAACNRRSPNIEAEDVEAALTQSVKRAEQSIVSKFTCGIRSARRDALYPHVLIACAITASRTIDELGYFQAAGVVEPLSRILGRDVDIAAFYKHLAEFCEAKRARILQRTGTERNYRYRFSDPLLPPYVIMNGLSTGLLPQDVLDRLTRPARSNEDVPSNEQLPLF